MIVLRSRVYSRPSEFAHLHTGKRQQRSRPPTIPAASALPSPILYTTLMQTKHNWRGTDGMNANGHRNRRTNTSNWFPCRCCVPGLRETVFPTVQFSVECPETVRGTVKHRNQLLTAPTDGTGKQSSVSLDLEPVSIAPTVRLAVAHLRNRTHLTRERDLTGVFRDVAR